MSLLSIGEQTLTCTCSYQPAPLPVAPGGSRYSVDEAKSWVVWQDFSFYYTFSRDSGIRLFDIHYKGDRIIYELGLEEAIAHYAVFCFVRLCLSNAHTHFLGKRPSH